MKPKKRSKNMFYCDKCGKERSWPTDTLAKSTGPCEICGKQLECNDIPVILAILHTQSKK
jgi:transcription elongation factor Elf1